MKKFFVLPLLLSLSIFASCEKQTDADRQAEVDRKVQEKLDAEHQAQQREDLARREGELSAREKGLAQSDTETAPAAETPEPESRSGRSRDQRNARIDEQEPTGSYNTFYTKLDQYGDWRETSDYGYVFQPRQAQQSRSWRPYTEGRWVYSDAGWTWVSEEPFGWATYHYGRWTRLRNIGWVWVPGDEWAPAWVSWRKSDDYVGWAPLPPEARFDRRTGIHNWSDNYYDIGPEQYCFVETKQFGAPRLERSLVSPDRNVTIINQTTNVTNITYSNTLVINQGPSYDELRTRSAQPIERLRLERQVNIDVNVDPRAVVRGQVIAVPAPLIARAQAVERPRVVKEKVVNVVIERGWDGTGDRQASERARAHMRAEATPPPNAPSKTFVKPVQASAETSSSAPRSTSTPAASVAPSTTPTPAASAAASSAETSAPSATPTPFRRGRPDATATATPAASASATAAPSATATAAATAAASPSASAALNVSPASPTPAPYETPRVGGKFRSIKKMMEERAAQTKDASPSPAAGASVSPALPTDRPVRRKVDRPLPTIADEKAASPSPTATPTQSASPGQMESKAQKVEPRHVVPMTSPVTSATPSPSASASASEASSPAAEATAASAPGNDKRDKKDEKRKHKHDRDAAAEGSPIVPFPTPTPADR